MKLSTQSVEGGKQRFCRDAPGGEDVGDPGVGGTESETIKP
jgi:hypothetical protein